MWNSLVSVLDLTVFFTVQPVFPLVEYSIVSGSTATTDGSPRRTPSTVTFPHGSY